MGDGITRDATSGALDAHSWRSVLLLLGVLALAACSSTDRLWRISPLSSDGEGSSERVNLWPFAYHGSAGTSVLWPFFDVDDQGFALRPLVSQDGGTWSVLYPWMSWDTDAGTGWAFPYYHTGDSFGIFPVAHFGKLSWITLVWWKKDDTGSVAASGLFPIAHFGSFRYVGPFWRGEGGDTWGVLPLAGNYGNFNQVLVAYWFDDESTWGFFPLFHWGEGGSELVVLPFYAHELHGDSRTRLYLMGLGGTHAEGDARRAWLLPLWYSREQPGAEDDVLFPLFYRRERGSDMRLYTPLGHRRTSPDRSRLDVYPLWWSSTSPDEAKAMLLPLFYYDRDGESRSFLTPLGGRGWSASGDTRFVNVLGPLYHRSRAVDGSESRTAFLWPLFERHREDDETTTRMIPLFGKTSTPEGSRTWFAAGLGDVRTTEEASSWRLFPLASVSREEERPDLLYKLSLYSDQSHGGESDRNLFPLYRAVSKPDYARHDLLLGAVQYKRDGDKRSWRAWPLVAYSDGFTRTSFLYDLSLFGRAHFDGGSSFHVGGPLLYLHQDVDRAGRSESHSRFLTFLTHDVEKTTSGHVPGTPGQAWQNQVERHKTGFLFDSFVSERARYRSWAPDLLDDDEARQLHRWSRAYDDNAYFAGQRDPAAARAILEEHGVAPESGDDDALQRAVHAFAEANSELSSRRHARIPLLYGYERTDETSEWYGPLWLFHAKRDAERSRTSFLYYGYKSETEGDRTSRDIFPFITWDTAPDEKTVSFLWRLFRYERKGDARGGYVFFVPWGDV